jgi:hypothetical protein
MEDDERELLRLDYTQTTELVGTLTDIRFKLLAFVPTIAGATVGLLSDTPPAAQLIAVGLLGFVATAGVVMYELRNTQLHDAAVHRAQVLEERLGLTSIRSDRATGGPFTERPGRTLLLLGRVTVWHDRGLALVYAAALAAWTYLLGWGLLSAADVYWARAWGALLGVAVGVLVILEVHRIGLRSDDRAFG